MHPNLSEFLPPVLDDEVRELPLRHTIGGSSYEKQPLSLTAFHQKSENTP
jgi:hypothetical protein